jgi:hypothetical protein
VTTAMKSKPSTLHERIAQAFAQADKAESERDKRTLALDESTDDAAILGATTKLLANPRARAEQRRKEAEERRQAFFGRLASQKGERTETKAKRTDADSVDHVADTLAATKTAEELEALWDAVNEAQTRQAAARQVEEERKERQADRDWRSYEWEFEDEYDFMNDEEAEHGEDDES